MKKNLQTVSGKFAKKDVSGSLKKKAAVCSAEAAAISIAIHVLIIVFAGSIVAYEYIKRQDAAFEGQNIKRPKLERRQLQMPVKVQNLQKKSRRPKVSTRMTTASKSALALPDMSALGMGFGKDGGSFGDSVAAASAADGTQELSSMGAAGSLGFGISKVNFFGAKSKGEKIVFIVDTSKEMVTDAKGGYYTYKFAKDRIRQMVDKMRAATLFNVILYNTAAPAPVALFSPRLLPATTENKEALKVWLKPVNSDPENVGDLEKIKNYSPGFEYETELGTRARSWTKAAQAAMEQKADNIFILAAGWGSHTRPAELSEEEFAAWRSERGWPPKRVAEFERLEDEREEKVLELLAKENKARAKKGLPPRIVAAMWRYEKEMESQLPKLPPGPPLYRPAQGWSYTCDEIIEHLDGVYEYNYIPEKLKKPKIHFVKLIAADADEGGGDEPEREELIYLRRVTRAFKGDFEFLRGANTMEDLLKYNRTLDEE